MGPAAPIWFRLVWGVVPPVVAGLVLAARPAPALGGRPLLVREPPSPSARRAFHRRVRRAIAVGLLAHVVAVAIGRAYLIWYHAAHPCTWCGDDWASFDVGLALRTAIVVPLTYVVGLVAVFSTIRRAEDGFADSSMWFALAIIGAVVSTLVAAMAMPFAMGAGSVVRWTWVIVALVGPPLACGLPYLIDRDVSVVRGGASPSGGPCPRPAP
jgi:hypothetical protein